MPHILHYNYTISKSSKKYVNDKIREEYFGKEHVNRENFHILIDVIGDRLFKADIDKCTRIHAANIKSPVFHYLFDYRGAHSKTEIRSGTKGDIGVSHADDTMYVLKTTLDTLSTEEDRSVSKFMVDVFETFAKYGEPKIEIEWPEVSKSITEPIVYLKITSTLDIEDEETLGNRKFWDSLPFQENERLFTAKTEL
ncbi:hypothetical protein WA026_005236 [Henosepilachna vigintioctopunctata]|uniref:Carboxylesterase type B domain-containing protein n=1 Tax=Henosepilachna vigintioctopunctata TaxID=420089 RepID=A0AAW1UMI9_9CUCU